MPCAAAWGGEDARAARAKSEEGVERCASVLRDGVEESARYGKDASAGGFTRFHTGFSHSAPLFLLICVL